MTGGLDLNDLVWNRGCGQQQMDEVELGCLLRVGSSRGGGWPVSVMNMFAPMSECEWGYMLDPTGC